MTCFLCDWIREDLKRNGRLTDWSPADAGHDQKNFPLGAKIAHLKLEAGSEYVDKCEKLSIISVD